jgi:hypothetical protein
MQRTPGNRSTQQRQDNNLIRRRSALVIPAVRIGQKLKAAGDKPEQQ